MVDIIQFGLDILGVFIGAFAAFELENLRERRNDRKEEVRVLRLIRTEVNDNGQLLNKLQNTLRDFPEGVPYTRLRNSIWRGVASKLELVTNDKLLTDLTGLYYAIDLVDRTLDTYSEHATLNIHEVNVEVQKAIQARLDIHRNVLVTNITTPRTGLIDMCKAIAEEIDRETNG